jgi:hypothetical protein
MMVKIVKGGGHAPPSLTSLGWFFHHDGMLPLCSLRSSLLIYFTPPPPLSKSGLKLVCNINIVYGNLKSENSKDYAQKPQRNCTFMNSPSGQTSIFFVFHSEYLTFTSVCYVLSTACILGHFEHYFSLVLFNLPLYVHFPYFLHVLINTHEALKKLPLSKQLLTL